MFVIMQRKREKNLILETMERKRVKPRIIYVYFLLKEGLWELLFIFVTVVFTLVWFILLINWSLKFPLKWLLLSLTSYVLHLSTPKDTLLDSLTLSLKSEILKLMNERFWEGNYSMRWEGNLIKYRQTIFFYEGRITVPPYCFLHNSYPCSSKIYYPINAPVFHVSSFFFLVTFDFCIFFGSWKELFLLGNCNCVLKVYAF